MRTKKAAEVLVASVEIGFVEGMLKYTDADAAAALKAEFRDQLPWLMQELRRARRKQLRGDPASPGAGRATGQ